jgi:hypothetical protein
VLLLQLEMEEAAESLVEWQGVISEQFQLSQSKLLAKFAEFHQNLDNNRINQILWNFHFHSHCRNLVRKYFNSS